jgi:hypothetical protein
VDDRDLQRVGVQVRRLAVQKHGVHAVESLHIPPPMDGFYASTRLPPIRSLSPNGSVISS